MPAITEVVEFLHRIAPPDLAEEWDNVGLLVQCGQKASSILVALDITPAVVQEARQKNCQLIVAHHPVIFSGLRRIGPADVAYQLVQAQISALCAHTNLDAAEGGVNDVLAACLGLQDVQPFAQQLGRVGTLAAPMPMQDFAALCARQLGTAVQCVNTGTQVQRVAVVGGAGKDFLQQAAQAGAHCFVTGEAGHHTALDAAQLGINLIAAGHFSTEHLVVQPLADKLRKRFTTAAVYTSEAEHNPFELILP